MKVAIGNDHHGVDVKNRIIKYLEERNIQYLNFGTDTKENRYKIKNVT